MSARDELPEGWFVEPTRDGWVLFDPHGYERGGPFIVHGAATDAAWRIVDAEKEAKDGR